MVPGAPVAQRTPTSLLKSSTTRRRMAGSRSAVSGSMVIMTQRSIATSAQSFAASDWSPKIRVLPIQSISREPVARLDDDIGPEPQRIDAMTAARGDLRDSRRRDDRYRHRVEQAAPDLDQTNFFARSPAEVIVEPRIVDIVLVPADCHNQTRVPRIVGCQITGRTGNQLCDLSPGQPREA